ncbi:MAG: CinA family protein [Candidatus Omnitrophica bacterium]|nr:CinA family protein [Candidatus Omnitrophota bacterium]
MTIPRIIAQKLIDQHRTLAVAESCTGGLISKTLTDIPGSSAFFVAGFVAYANSAKVNFLKVPSALIERHGAVSAPVVRAMALGARTVTGADCSVAVTGIAGPTGSTTSKPVGLVFLSVSYKRRTIVKRYVFNGTRGQVRQQAAATALEMLAACLQ